MRHFRSAVTHRQEESALRAGAVFIFSLLFVMILGCFPMKPLRVFVSPQKEEENDTGGGKGREG